MLETLLVEVLLMAKVLAYHSLKIISKSWGKLAIVKGVSLHLGSSAGNVTPLYLIKVCAGVDRLGLVWAEVSVGRQLVVDSIGFSKVPLS